MLEEKILERLFPHNRFMEEKTSTVVFSQGSSESLNEAWERFKGNVKVMVLMNLLKSISFSMETLLDATTGGSLISKSA